MAQDKNINHNQLKDLADLLIDIKLKVKDYNKISLDKIEVEIRSQDQSLKNGVFVYR